MLNVIHRFTPPTCTLEIKGKKSPLSRWQNKDILKKLQFKLSLDDPRLPTNRQITIQGDRQELENLKAIVDDYIQNYLNPGFELPKESALNINNHRQVDGELPYLKTQGLVNHELFLGNLNRDRNTNKIKLSTVQLFDLVSALEAYNTQFHTLPELNQNQAKSLVPLWSSIAAVVLVAVGIATVLLEIPSGQNVISSSKSKPSTPIPQLDEVVPPQAFENDKKQKPQLKPNQTLSSAKRLPPPPAVDTPKPKPNIPDPADYSLSKVARNSGLNRQQAQAESTITVPLEPERESANSNFNIELPQQNDPTIPEATTDNSKPQLKSERLKDPLLESANSKQENIVKSLPTQLSQIQQVRAYFQEKWQPPADLRQSLEYRLYLNADGSIKRVVPIGKASKLYLSKTEIPVRGETFISPSTKSQSSVIRLLLNPDGGVKVLIEE